MYIDLNIGKKGEIVIPASIRRQYRIQEGQTIKLKAEENQLIFILKDPNVVNWFRQISAKEGGIPKKKLIYGDKLYEEVF